MALVYEELADVEVDVRAEMLITGEFAFDHPVTGRRTVMRVPGFKYDFVEYGVMSTLGPGPDVATVRRVRATFRLYLREGAEAWYWRPEPGPVAGERVRPFANATEFMLFLEENCFRCARPSYATAAEGADPDDPALCELERAVADESDGDGEVSRRTGERIGYVVDGREVTPYIPECTEFKPKAEPRPRGSNTQHLF